MPKMLISVLAFIFSHAFAESTQMVMPSDEQQKGLARLKTFQWRVGFTLPQHYRNEHYKVKVQNTGRLFEKSKDWYYVQHTCILINQDNIIIDVKKAPESAF